MSSAFHSGNDAAVVARTVVVVSPVPRYSRGVFRTHTESVRHGPFAPR